MIKVFRSNLEKRWAEVFNELGIKYEYESKKFDVNVHDKNCTYVPDFYLPEQKLIIEVKAPHKWEGRGLAKSRALAESGQKIICCKDNGKFFFLGEPVKEGVIYKCNDCNKFFFSEKQSEAKCIYCNSFAINKYTTGEKGIPHWYNFEKDKWLFNEVEYQKMFSVSSETNQNNLENIHNHLQGVPEIVEYSPEIIESLTKLLINYPNMEEVQNYFENYTKTLELRNDKKICFQPILLVGSPGCGKTSFATELAKIIMNREPEKLEMGNGITYFDIVGSSPDYKSATCGKIIRSMFSESPKPPIKNPIIIIDEFEKIKIDEHSCENVFYTLFDKKSSEIFTDSFLRVSIDASDVNYIATANSLDGIPKPILDRMKIFFIRDYTVKEIKEIIIPNVYKEWLEKENIKKNRVPKVLSKEIVDKVYMRSNGELRKIPIALSECLLEFMHFDKASQEYISLFANNELSKWQELAGSITFDEEWKLEKKEEDDDEYEYSLNIIDDSVEF